MISIHKALADLDSGISRVILASEMISIHKALAGLDVRPAVLINQ